jgi:hypothetical protein
LNYGFSARYKFYPPKVFMTAQQGHSDVEEENYETLLENSRRIDSKEEFDDFVEGYLEENDGRWIPGVMGAAEENTVRWIEDVYPNLEEERTSSLLDRAVSRDLVGTLSAP